MRLLVLRPEPGALATAARAAAMGFDPAVAPLFHVEPLAWDPPDPGVFDALMMTSANASRHGGAALGRYAGLPALAVGAATAAAMRDAGLRVDIVGTSDAAALLRSLRAAGYRRVLHLCGEHRKSPAADDVTLTAVPVYASRACEALAPMAIVAARNGAVALLHSPRAATLFGKLVDVAALDRRRIDIVAISTAAARAAGAGWRGVSAAAAPCDADMLAIARALCQNPPR